MGAAGRSGSCYNGTPLEEGGKNRATLRVTSLSWAKRENRMFDRGIGTGRDDGGLYGGSYKGAIRRIYETSRK